LARYIGLGTTEKKPKVGVSRNKCSHKQALCILKCLALGRGNNSACNMPFNYTSNVGLGLYGFNPSTFLMASCANKIILIIIIIFLLVCFFSLHILKYLVSCTNKIISCTYYVNYAN
jgi:hypothetical protein